MTAVKSGGGVVMESVMLGLAFGAIALYVLVNNWSDEVGS
jgi:hypothetical protein